jgi:hypothetical protein
MNKYVLRTSLVWIIVLAAIAGIWAYRTHAIKQPTAMKTPMSGEMQPVASGPPATADEPKPSMSDMPNMKMDAPLVPVQLTPERMQSIGVQTGTVEYKQLSDDIRATGTVDINERLLSYVQVRFPGYIRKVFANATYQYVRKGEPLFTIYSPDLVATQQEYLLARQNQKTMSASTIDGVADGAATFRPRRNSGYSNGIYPRVKSQSSRKPANQSPTSPSTRRLRDTSPSEMLCPICMPSLRPSSTPLPICRASGCTPRYFQDDIGRISLAIQRRSPSIRIRAAPSQARSKRSCRRWIWRRARFVCGWRWRIRDSS